MEGIKVAGVSGVAAAVIAGVVFIATGRQWWGLFFVVVAVTLAVITRKA